MRDLVEPAHLWVPPHTRSALDDALGIAEIAGLTPDPEQRIALESVLAEGDDGNWATLESALIAPRQNLKTFCFQIMALTSLFVWDLRLVVWTAHLFSTTQEAVRDLEHIIERTPDFDEQVIRKTHGHSDVGFELTDDRRLLFLARSKTGGRGLTGDLVILDEAWALGAAEMGSLLPTLSARPNPKVAYGSSAGLIGSGFLREIRDRGRAGGDPSLSYAEWCAPEKVQVTAPDGTVTVRDVCATEHCDHHKGADGCAADDPEMWRSANPALGRRITESFVRAERRTMPVDEFTRERLGWWDEPAIGVDGIPEDVWALCADREAALSEPVALSFDVALGHTSASLVACGRALHVTDQHKSTHWVVKRLGELCEQHDVEAIGYDPGGPAAALLPELERAGFVIRTSETPDGLLVPIDGRDIAQACEGFLAGVIDGTLVHRDQQALNTAVAGAGRRQSGDAWRWSRRASDGDITALYAATFARYLWNKPERLATVSVYEERGPVVL